MRLWNHKPQISHPTEAKCILNLCQLVSTQRPTRSRPKRAYANAYATYAVCMGAYMSCGVPPLFFCIQEKQTLAQMPSTMGQSLIIFASSPTKSTERCAPALRVPTCLRPNTCATPWIWMMLNWCGRHEAVGVDTGYRLRCWLSYDSIPFCPIMSRLDLDCLAWAEMIWRFLGRTVWMYLLGSCI